MIVERKVKLVTAQHNIDKPSPMEGFPMKEWSIEIFVLDEEGNEHPAKCFTRVVYNLHPSFENPVQSEAFHEPPFRCQNEGWGEFALTVDCYTTEKGGKSTIEHDLNFGAPKYENIHTITFKNPSQALQQTLRETGPLPNDDNPKGKARKTHDGKRKKGVDVEKMAEALPRLSEDDLLQVIQMIHDNKTDDTYIKNDVDAGEFSVDLYTLPDNLAKSIWDFLVKNGVVS
ncbi:hypothetical protein MKZ38_009125 [Zalerion maritima]|uniref:YEATS domain-containing protein n=1 Tax=Zalerion maritima TaxID=339359 RepID=A0AAD5WNB2_9PEZI|nr:hypothetical protein MKZ38_009125 [Zalerion maritima]